MVEEKRRNVVVVNKYQCIWLLVFKIVTYLVKLFEYRLPCRLLAKRFILRKANGGRMRNAYTANDVSHVVLNKNMPLRAWRLPGEKEQIWPQC